MKFSYCPVWNDRLIPEKLRNRNYEIIELKIEPYELIVLPNKNILITDYECEAIQIYNSNFNKIRKVEMINILNKKIEPSGFAVSDKNVIYISDKRNSLVIMTDLDLTLIKSVGEDGSTGLDFHYPHDLYFKNNLLYVCDKYNKRIQILSPSLDYVNSIQLDCNPSKITVSNSSLCIIVDNNIEQRIEFYDLSSHTLSHTYQHGSCRISVLGSRFYEIVSNKLFCFTEHGELIYDMEIDIDIVRCRMVFPNKCNGRMVKHENNLLICCYNSKKLLKFI